MITLNLLPEVKKEHVKAQRVKRLIVLVSAGVSLTCIGLVVLLFLLVSVGQKVHLDNLSEDIKEHTATLNNIQDLDKILTIQNQLEHLPALHDQKPAFDRLFQFLTVITPDEVGLGAVNVSFTDGTLKIDGSAPDYRGANKFVDTLKNAEFTYKESVNGQSTQQSPAKAFSNVVVQSVGNNPEKPEDGTAFSVTANFETVLFDTSKQEVVMTVPNIISSPSVTGRPNPIFDGSGLQQTEEGETAQ